MDGIFVLFVLSFPECVSLSPSRSGGVHLWPPLHLCPPSPPHFPGRGTKAPEGLSTLGMLCSRGGAVLLGASCLGPGPPGPANCPLSCMRRRPSWFLTAQGGHAGMHTGTQAFLQGGTCLSSNSTWLIFTSCLTQSQIVLQHLLWTNCLLKPSEN